MSTLNIFGRLIDFVGQISKLSYYNVHEFDDFMTHH